MGKIVFLFFLFLASNTQGQDGVKIRVAKEFEPITENMEIVLFQISVTNRTNDTITIPDKYCLLKAKWSQRIDDVGYELTSAGKSDTMLCEYLVDAPLSYSFQPIAPFHTETINVTCFQNCFKTNKKYQIVLFFNIGTKNSIANKIEYAEYKTKRIFFEYKIRP